MKELEKFERAHKASVGALVRNGGYRSLKAAERYAEHHLAEMWRPVLRIDNDDLGIVDQLEFTPTMVLILHLFGKAVHHHGTERSKLPVIDAFMPIYDRYSERVRFPRALSKASIASAIGKSRSAVNEAVSRLRAKNEKYERLYSQRVAYAMWGETGIMLDMMTHPNLSFSFMVEDYEYARRVAIDARLADSETVKKQQDWCSEATRSAVGTPQQDSVPESAQRKLG